MPFDAQRLAADYHIVGFRECASEVARYLVTMEGMDIQDPMRLRLMSHLQCFVAQRELQVKSSASNDPMSPVSAVHPSVVNPVSPHMAQSPTTTSSTSNWSSYQHAGSNGGYHQMMPTTYQQNPYASQTATAQSGGYVPNLPPPLPHQYDQYGNHRSTGDSGANGYGSETGNSATRSGVTTRSQANNNHSGAAVSTSNQSLISSSSSNDMNNTNADQSNAGPTYTDLSSSTQAASSATVAPVSSSSSVSSSSVTAVSASSVGINNNRLQNNYNIYGHIHYPVDPASAAAAASFSGHHHPQHGYNLHLDPSRGGGYNGVQGNVGGGNAKPYRPWGAEMAY